MKLERLGNYIKQIRGLSYKPNEIHDEYQEGRIAILKANNIQDNVLDDTDLIYIDKSKTKTEQKIKKGDILIAASSGSKEIVGKNIYFRNDYEAVFGAFCKVVRINEKVNSEFISHFFKTPIYKNHIRNSIQGANINNLKNEHIDELKLAIPSLEEQKHIAVVLSKAEALIAERKQSIQLLDEYLKSTFLEMFGDPVENTKNYVKTALSNLLEVRGRVGWKGYKKSDLRMSGPYVLGATHLTHSGDIDLNDPVYISREKFEESPEIMVQIGDLLIVQRGNTIGKVGHVNISINEATINPCILILRPISINSFFLKHLFNNNKVQRVLWQMNTGSAQPMLTQSQLRGMEIISPPEKLQTQFAQIVEKTEVLKAQYKGHLQELEQLYGALSQRAFRGG